jgi:hypothetical protein
MTFAELIDFLAGLAEQRRTNESGDIRVAVRGFDTTTGDDDPPPAQSTIRKIGARKKR